MPKYVINGGNKLEGAISINGAKNAAVAILPAAILVDGVCRVENVPDISDVRILLDILADLGAVITHEEPGVVTLDCTNIRSTHPNPELVRKMRASYYLMGALLSCSTRPMWPCPAAATSPPAPSISTSRALPPWAPMWMRRKNM